MDAGEKQLKKNTCHPCAQIKGSIIPPTRHPLPHSQKIIPPANIPQNACFAAVPCSLMKVAAINYKLKKMKKKIMSLKVSFIKLLLYTGIIICSICTAVAQNTQYNYDKDVLVPKPTVIKSTATGNHAERKVTVKVWVKKETDLGYKVYYKASVPLRDVVVTGTDPVMEKQTILHNGNSDNGWVALESGAYKGSKNYTFTFFAHGLPEAVWIAGIQIKRRELKIKTFPKNN